MFILTTITDLIQLSPDELGKPTGRALEDNINAKYADKVIQNTGLCICLYEILKYSDGLIGHGTGIVNVNVKFRLVVFRPFKGEILEGVIAESTVQGIKSMCQTLSFFVQARQFNPIDSTVSLDFFDDIFVPGPSNLFTGSTYNNAEKVWVWTTEDGTEMFFDNNEVVRFRVEDEIWHNQAPQPPSAQRDAEDVPERKPPYSLVASMTSGGLGPVLWWEG